MMTMGPLSIPALLHIFLLISTGTLLLPSCEAAAGVTVSSRHLLRNDEVLGPWRSADKESLPAGFLASDSASEEVQYGRNVAQDQNQRREVLQTADQFVVSGKRVDHDRPQPPPDETPASPSGAFQSPPPPDSSPPPPLYSSPPPPLYSSPPPPLYSSPPPPLYSSPPPPLYVSPPPPLHSSPPPPPVSSPPPPSHPPPPPKCDDDDDKRHHRHHPLPHRPRNH